jgi:hypothetical protein
MWIVKGILLGTLVFVVGSIIYYVGAMPTGTTALQWNILNPLFWLAFVATLILGCVVVKQWPRRANP